MRKLIISIIFVMSILFTACSRSELESELTTRETESTTQKQMTSKEEATATHKQTTTKEETTTDHEEYTEPLTEGGVGEMFSTYDELIDIIRDACKNGWEYDYVKDLGISSDFYYLNPDNAHKSGYGYCLMDLDENGTEELILGVSGSEENPAYICDVYTIVNGEMVHVLNGWVRNRFYLCENGMLLNKGSSGAADNAWAYYSYSNGKINLVEAIRCIEGEMHYFDSSADIYEFEEGVDITSEKFDEIQSKYIKVNIELKSFIE